LDFDPIRVESTPATMRRLSKPGATSECGIRGIVLDGGADRSLGGGQAPAG